MGETSLERKCRFLFGAGTLLLITGSFWLYAFQTESLAYKQIETTGRLLVNPIVSSLHDEKIDAKQWRWIKRDSGDNEPPLPPEDQGPERWRQLRKALDQFSEENLREAKLRQYQWRIIKPNARHRGDQPDDSFEAERLKEFLEDEQKNEYSRLVPSKQFVQYYGAVRATRDCLACHPHTAEEKATLGDLREGGLMAVMNIRMPTDTIERGVDINRAVLISTALLTALLIMGASYLIVRYVIVKPVKHLKEVSDAIAAGKLNVRSEIQTGDEFEDLSHAFNRMLRNLVSMQDQWRKVNEDLDRKVDELAHANLALYESNRLKSDFLATMSHELRTPLNSILGFSDVLLSAPHLTDKAQRWVQNIRTSGDQLLCLINDILDLAKIEAGKMQVRIEEFSVLDVCEGLINMFRPMAERKNIELRSQIDPNMPLLRQDVGKLQQILSNLLSNAIKFTPEGGRVLLKIEAEPSHIVVTVTDTGVGIVREDQDLIFEKFRQSGNPLTREHAGTGLGLSIVRELSKLLGGEVTLQSELGRGSTFTVRLPLQLSQEPRLEFDLADEGIDLTKAQRVDVRLFARSQFAGESGALAPAAPPDLPVLAPQAPNGPGAPVP